jgi:hypothetical protein
MKTLTLSEPDKRAILIIGPSQSGKTRRANECCEGLETLFVHAEMCESHAALVETVDNFLNVSKIRGNFKKEGKEEVKEGEEFTKCWWKKGSKGSQRFDELENKKIYKHNNKKKCIVFDDVDILLTQDRIANTYIQSLILCEKEKDKEKEIFDVVITCSSCEERRVTDLKKCCNEIERLTKKNVGENSSCSPLNEYQDKNIYELVESIFESKGSLQDLEIALSSDPTLVSYLMYDNWPHWIRRYVREEEVIRVLPLITKTFMEMSSSAGSLSFSSSSFSYASSSSASMSSTSSVESNYCDYGDLVSCFAIRLCLKELLGKWEEGEKEKNEEGENNQNKNKKKKDKEGEEKEKEKEKERIKYTQVTSRSAQHHNVAKKYMVLPYLTANNVESIVELYYEKTKGRRKKVEASPLGGAVQAFLFNLSKKSL